MGTTSNYAFPYPDVTDGPFAPAQLQALAAAVDTRVKTVADSIPAGGGGGGTTATVWDAWQASSAQSISSGNDVTVAFGTALGSGDGVVTRATSGSGHSFTLTQAKLWTITATIRFSQSSVGGRLVTLLAGGAVLAKVGGDASSTPWTACLAKARRLPAGTVITVIARHNAGSSLALDHESGPSVSIDFAGV